MKVKNIEKHLRKYVYFLVFSMLSLFITVQAGYASAAETFEDRQCNLDLNPFPMSLLDSIPLAKDPDSASLEFMESHIQMIQSDLSEIERQIQALRKKYKDLSSLIPQEQILFSRVQALEILFSNRESRSDYNKFHSDLSEAILAFSEERVQKYQALSLEQKKRKVQSDIDCYEQLLDVYKSYADLADEMQFLEEAFTRKVLNPYTMTDMDERQKRIIFDRFVQILFPYVLEDVSQHLNCENVELKMGNFQILKEKLLQLRDEETDELEDKMQEETNPKKLFDLLDLDLQLK